MPKLVQLYAWVCDYKTNFNFNGPPGSQDVLVTQAADVTECAQKCWDNAQCEYFVKSNTRNECYLKKNYLSESADANWTSGMKCDPSTLSAGKHFFCYLVAKIFF